MMIPSRGVQETAPHHERGAWNTIYPIGSGRVAGSDWRR
jgi:hypothetical protein